MSSGYYKNHLFFGDDNARMLSEIDNSLTYGIAFSEDFIEKLIGRESLRSADAWCEADRAFRFFLTSAQRLLRHYLDVMRQQEKMYFLDYDLRGEFKLASTKMKAMPPNTFYVDACGIPESIGLGLNPDEMTRQFVHLQAGFHVKNNVSQVFSQITKGRKKEGFAEGHEAASRYWLYAYGVGFLGGTSQLIAHDFELPMIIEENTSNGTGSVWDTVRKIKETAHNSNARPSF